MKAKASTVQEVARKLLTKRKAHNERQRENAAYSGSRTGAVGLKNTRRLQGLVEGLNCADSEKRIAVPAFLEPAMKDHLDEKEKKEDPEWQEYQRLKNKFKNDD